MADRITVHGAIVEGASAVPIDIVIETRPGLPGISIAGLQDNAPLIIDFIRTPPTFIRTCADECGNPIP